jgi:putative FmdB family regulatory protein
MPIYEYRCDECGTEFEKRVATSAATDGLTCPSCGEAHLTRKLSLFAARSGAPRNEGTAPPCAGGVCPHPDLCGGNN